MSRYHQEVWVTFRVAGFHRWPDAPPRRAYLRQKHRHLFGFRVSIETHADRQIEFHELRERAIERVGGTTTHDDAIDFDEQSCEQIAKKLCDKLSKDYPGAVSVNVSEDGEFGAIVRRRD